jgi:hypothetical protein
MGLLSVRGSVAATFWSVSGSFRRPRPRGSAPASDNATSVNICSAHVGADGDDDTTGSAVIVSSLLSSCRRRTFRTGDERVVTPRLGLSSGEEATDDLVLRFITVMVGEVPVIANTPPCFLQPMNGWDGLL